MYAAHTQYAFQELYINKHVKFLLSMKSCTLYLNTVIITIMCVQ